MNGWQIVPKGLDKAMLEVALRYDIFHAIRPAGGRVATTLYQDVIAAAPRPPVVLPLLPEAAHGYYGVPMYSADQMQAYARAALAQYGIKEQSDVER